MNRIWENKKCYSDAIYVAWTFVCRILSRWFHLKQSNDANITAIMVMLKTHTISFLLLQIQSIESDVQRVKTDYIIIEYFLH